MASISHTGPASKQIQIFHNPSVKLLLIWHVILFRVTVGSAVFPSSHWLKGSPEEKVWSRLDTEQLHLPHCVFVPQSRHHDDHPDVLLPHHPPEVGHGALQRPLGADEVSLRSSTLNTKTTGFSSRGKKL